MFINIYQKIENIVLSKKKISDIVAVGLKFFKKKQAEVSVHLIGDMRMRTINKKYRGIDKTTDVLAFAAQEGEVFSENDLGDIFISIPQIRRQAKENNVSEKEELTRIIMHGILHLAGYNHNTKLKAKKMFFLQEKLVKRFLYGSVAE